MSDLISRSDVVQILKECKLDETLFEKDVFDKINNLPIAYSVAKVVDELGKKKEEVQRMRNTCIALSDLEVCDIENATYERAIEIVKQGVVRKDVE